MRMRSGFDPDFLCVLILVLGSLGSSLNMQFIFSFHRENLKSSLEESLKNLEIVKSRCHSCLEYSEKEEEELSWEAWQFARKKLVLSCEPQAPTGVHHLLSINKSWMCKIFAFFRNLISSISGSKLGYSLKRGGSGFSIFTCLFHPSYKVKKLIQFLKTRDIWLFMLKLAAHFGHYKSSCMVKNGLH